MNAMLSSMRRHYITRLGLSLLIVALIAGLTGCVGETTHTVRYDLNIASGAGGSVTVPGEGTFKCDAGRVVELLAIPTSGYRFLKWTGSATTIANPNAASTTITMNGNYSITATFEETEATFYTLTVGVTGSGSTSPSGGSAYVFGRRGDLHQRHPSRWLSLCQLDRQRGQRCQCQCCFHHHHDERQLLNHRQF